MLTVRLLVQIDVPSMTEKSAGAEGMQGCLSMGVLHAVEKHVQQINRDAGTILLGEAGVKILRPDECH